MRSIIRAFRQFLFPSNRSSQVLIDENHTLDHAHNSRLDDESATTNDMEITALPLSEIPRPRPSGVPFMSPTSLPLTPSSIPSILPSVLPSVYEINEAPLAIDEARNSRVDDEALSDDTLSLIETERSLIIGTFLPLPTRLGLSEAELVEKYNNIKSVRDVFEYIKYSDPSHSHFTKVGYHQKFDNQKTGEDHISYTILDVGRPTSLKVGEQYYFDSNNVITPCEEDYFLTGDEKNLSEEEILTLIENLKQKVIGPAPTINSEQTNHRDRVLNSRQSSTSSENQEQVR